MLNNQTNEKNCSEEATKSKMTASESVHIQIEGLLKSREIKPTANRILVYRELMKAKNPVSLSDLDTLLYPMDTASIFRVLDIFSKKDVVHVIEDGSRSIKYELCHGKDSQHRVADQHAHFHCEKCGKTICLDSISVPIVEVPEGFEIHHVNYMLKGICPECGKKK